MHRIKSFVQSTAALMQAAAVLGHMHLYHPPTFNASNNPHRTTAPDPYLDYPYNCCGRQDPFPCKGYLSLLGTPDGASVASWPAGSIQNFSLTADPNGGNHYGGSCQVGFSIDNGTTWKTATTFEGNCPHRNGGISPDSQTFRFTVPADIPPGDHVFMWNWVNREREFQSNCAAVTITTTTPDESSRSGVGNAASPPNKNRPTTSLRHFRTPGSNSIAIPTTLIKQQAASSSTTAPAKHISHHTYGSGKAKAPAPGAGESSVVPAVAFQDRPDMLFADLLLSNEGEGGCSTPLTTAELKYPHPGPDVAEGDGEYPLELPNPADQCGIE